MYISDGPFNKPLLEKKISALPPQTAVTGYLYAHSCGLGGKYWYKHTKVFQTEHLKRLVQCGLETWLFFPCWLTVSNLLMTEWDKCYFYIRYMSLSLFPTWPSPHSVLTPSESVSESVSISPTGVLVGLAVSAYNRTTHAILEKPTMPSLRAWYRMHRRMNKYWDVCVGFKGLYFPVLSFSAYSSGVL